MYGRGQLQKGLRKGQGLGRQEGIYQQVGPALPASQSDQQHLLDQRQLPLACGLLLSDFTLCSGLSKGTVHQDPLSHREVLNQEYQPPVWKLVDLKRGQWLEVGT